MVTLGYGKKVMEIADSKFLSLDNQRLLLDGKFVVDTGIDVLESNKKRKIYYVGVLFEIFEKNFYPQFSKKEIYAMMLSGYPLFINSRQIENLLFDYYQLKKKHDVFTSVK